MLAWYAAHDTFKLLISEFSSNAYLPFSSHSYSLSLSVFLEVLPPQRGHTANLKQWYPDVGGMSVWKLGSWLTVFE